MLLAVIALSAPGCTSFREYVSNGLKVGPNYRRPPVPVADDWIDAADMRLRKDALPELARWWTALNDPVLDELIADAYRQNLTLREAGFRILQYRAMLGIAVGGFFPQQQYMMGDYTRNSISTQAANRPFVLEQFFPQWDFGFTLNWELDFWGRFRRAIASAGARLDATVEDFDGVLVTMLADVAQAYTQIRIYEQQIALTKANVQLQRQTLTLATARFRGGLVTELDVDQAQSILSQTEAQIPQLEISLRQANNRLCVLLGIPPQDLELRMAPRPIPTVSPDIAIGIPADLVRRRPDVRRAERDTAAQAEQIGIAQSEFYPHISLNGAFAYSAEEFNGLFSSRALNGSWGPTFQWNLLNYGRILNNVRAQDAIFQQLVAHYQLTVLRAGQEVEDGLVMFLKSQQQMRFMAESVRAALKAAEVAIAQYKGGLVDFNRVSLVEQNLVQQQNLYAQAYGSISLGLIQTYRALGGGWEIRFDPAANSAPGLPPADPNRQQDQRPAMMPLLSPPPVPGPVGPPGGEVVPAPAPVPPPTPPPAASVSPPINIESPPTTVGNTARSGSILGPASPPRASVPSPAIWSLSELNRNRPAGGPLATPTSNATPRLPNPTQETRGNNFWVGMSGAVAR